jgi:C-terminal processing protease CtpA/Prc
MSAAEQFTYNLKMLKRVTIVGETTAGQAHAGVFHRIDDHFGVGITELRPHNPFGSHDWEGTGVQPDVSVPATEALAKAQHMAERRLEKRQTRRN